MSNRVVMVGGSLLSFVDGFSPREQQDIMDSLALAQYSADKNVNPDSTLADWFDFFCESLFDVGWLFDAEGMSLVPREGVCFSLEEAALEGLKKVEQASLYAALKHSIEALKLDEASQEMFESRNRKHLMSHYQFVPCEPRNEFGSYMFVSGMRVTTRFELDNIFFNNKKIKTDAALDVQTASAGFYLKTEDYDPYRETVLQKLSEIGDDFFRNLKH